ncbi:MAG: VaFE repeat-containing surface-anchored protein [Bacteroides sp.]|nr:VaFE repeat-containing surface-anchored protein [Bacteroides sp.]MCM1548832.1 VaFE repeat-containing surface-anchored protein [Clostridium sp.]
MRKVKKMIAGVMSALMLLTNCPLDVLTVYAAELESPSATETDAAETVTIYKGGSYVYGSRTTNWYSTDEMPDSTNVNAYAIVPDYEMTESSITAESVPVTEEALAKAVYYSYGAPGYQNMQTDMEEKFLSCNAVTEEERAGISHLLLSGYAEEIYHCNRHRELTEEETQAVESLKACISTLPDPMKNFQVFLLSDTATENEYDLIFWSMKEEVGVTEAILQEAEIMETQLQTYANVEIQVNSYWQKMKDYIQTKGMLISGPNGYGDGGYNATSNWSCAGWTSRVIHEGLKETGVSNAHTPAVGGLQDGFLEVSDKFDRIYNMAGNASGTGCTSYDTIDGAKGATSTESSVAVANAENTFIELVNSGDIKAGDIIIFYGSENRTHAAIMGDTWTNSVPNICNALNESVGSTDKTPVSWLFTRSGTGNKSASGFAIYRYKEYGTMSLTKESGEPSITESDSHRQYYNLEGAVYKVTGGDNITVGLFETDSEGKGKVVASAEDAEGNTVTATMYNADDAGKETLTLLPGNYTVTEIKPPTDGSYRISHESQFVTVNYDSNTEVNEQDYIETASVWVTKESSNPDMTRDNGCYSLEGAEYTIYKMDRGDLIVAEYITEKDASGKIIKTAKAENLKTNADGELPVLEFPFDTYYVKETKASKGYQLDTCNVGTTTTMHEVTLEKADEIYPVTCKEVPVDDPINIMLVKWDEETNEKSALGGASLEGALFEVKYYDGYYSNTNQLPQEATRTWVIKTIFDRDTGNIATALDKEHFVSGDDLYYQENNTVLPLGTVTIREIQAPEGYKILTDGGAMFDANGKIDNGIFIGQVRENATAIKGASLYVGDKIQGAIITGNPLTTTAISVYEPLVRGDLAFTKLDFDTRKEMGNIPFRITSTTTRESHIVVTDSAGYYSSNSSHIKHTENTNGNDKYLSQDLTSYDDCVETGIWFYGTADKSKWDTNLIDDTKSALPYDTYIIEELSCSKNQGKQLELIVEAVISEEYDDKIKNIGIITDIMEPQITTYARDTKTEGHLSVAEADVTIVDTVSYQFLTAGETYTVKGILMNQSTSADEENAKPLLDNNGNPIVAQTTFTVDSDYETNEKEKCGTVDVTYHFDGRNLAGETYVIFAYLFEGNNTAPLYENGSLNLTGAMTRRDGEVVRHTDLTDTNQTGTFPSIDTAAWTEKTGYNVSPAEENVVIHDKVSYTGLIPTYEYRLEGTLMDRDSGEELLDENGEPIKEIRYFVPEQADGELEIVFDSVDATGMEGNATVVYERLYWNNRNYASHVNLDDAEQTIFYPVIGTQAKDSETDEDRACADDSVTIVDTVIYENLMPGYEYKLRGELISQKTGEPITISKGTKITAETTFIPEDFSGSVDVAFTFDAIDAELEGAVTVCYETLLIDDIELANHKDKNDKGQTIYFPSLKTSLRDADTGIQNTFLDEEIILVDTVSYTNLVQGKTYRLEGTLMNKATGKPVTVNGEAVTAETTFTAEKSNGTVEVTFVFDGIAVGLEKKNALVAFERLYYEKEMEGEKRDIIIGIHEDINDVEQTVTIPEIATTLLGKETEDHMANAGGKTTIVDHVAYSGLVPGKKYTMTGTLMMEPETDGTEQTEAAQPLLINGKKVTVSKTFIPDKTDGIIDIEFTLDASALAGTHVVAFEECTYEGKKVAIHADIEDEDQRVDFPEIHTNALDSETRDHVANADENVTLVDTISYENLLADRIYTVKGTLMNKKTGEPVKDAEGKVITAETTFNTGMPTVGSAISIDENGNVTETEIGEMKRRTVSGSVTVTFTFNASACGLEGMETVVFEELYCKGGLVAEHKDLDDKDQTITFGKIRTTAKDEATGMHTSAGGTVTITDTVTYSGLLAGKDYKLQGVLMDKTTGKPLLVNGRELRVEQSFTAEKSYGEITLSFTFDASALKGTTIVVFETVYYNGKEVAVHADINDHDQSVYFPEIKTTARDKADGDKRLVTEGIVTVVDTVSFTNLASGETYVVKGVLMDKTTGKPLLVNGQEVRAEKEFTPEVSDGSIEMEFTFAADGLKGKELVVFESLYLKATGELVTEHADLNDADQTVSVTAERHPKTGDETPFKVVILIAVLSLLAGCGMFFAGRRKRREV